MGALMERGSVGNRRHGFPAGLEIYRRLCRLLFVIYPIVIGPKTSAVQTAGGGTDDFKATNTTSLAGWSTSDTRNLDARP